MGVPSNVTVSPSVVAVRGMSADNTRHEPHMVCMFNDPGGDLYFLVRWYINNNLLTTTNYSAARYNDVNTTAALRPSHWTANYSMNMNVFIVLFNLILSNLYTCYSFSFKKKSFELMLLPFFIFMSLVLYSVHIL